MLDKAIYEHLSGNPELAPMLTRYAEKPAVFSQDAPADTDPKWAGGEQYGRIIFALDVQGDPARAMGGNLAVYVQCVAEQQEPEALEPVVRQLIDGYFFTDNGCTMAAQWVDSRYFTEASERVRSVALSFSLLAFPLLSATTTKVTQRVNEWTAERFPELLVINHHTLPAVWKPGKEKCAVYWRVASVNPAKWIPDTYQTVWRTAILKCHVFAPDVSKAALIAQEIIMQMYADRRIWNREDGQIMFDRDNTFDSGADALREGQATVEATFGEIVQRKSGNPLNHINFV